MAREKEMTQEEIDAKLAELEETPSEEVEVEPEQEEVAEEEESAASEDDTDEEEPSESEGDDEDEEEEEELDLSKSEAGLLKTAISERKKRQETEAKLERIQETLESLENAVKGSQQPATIEEAYERDQKGVIDNINASIANADAEGNTLEVERLRDLKEDLRQKLRQKQESKQQITTKQTEIAAQLFSNVPDFGPEKAKLLTAFAIKNLEYTDKELSEKCNINKYGLEAVREIVRINKLYEKTKIPDAALKKKVKKPTTVEKGGKGAPKTKTNVQALVKEARKTGDWQSVLEARGL